MRKVQVLFSVALVVLFGSIANAAIPGGGSTSDGVISLVYNPADGNLKFDAAGKKATSLEIQSPAGYFTGTKPPQANGLFDVYNKNKMFVLKPGDAAIGDTDFGPALIANGSLLPSGGLGTVDLVYVPEPSSVALLGLGMLGLLRARRNK
jgi:hypothetical protein